MLKTTHCPECCHEFERLRTNKLDHLVLAHRLRGIVSPYASGVRCPKCNRDCSDVTESVVAGPELLESPPANRDLAEIAVTEITVSETTASEITASEITASEITASEITASETEVLEEVQVDETLSVYETSDSDEFVTQFG